MTDNHLNKHVVVSSEIVRSTMQPRLRTLMAMKVINDNSNAKTDAAKQMWFVGVGLAVAGVVTVLF